MPNWKLLICNAMNYDMMMSIQQSWKLRALHLLSVMWLVQQYLNECVQRSPGLHAFAAYETIMSASFKTSSGSWQTESTCLGYPKTGDWYVVLETIAKHLVAERHHSKKEYDTLIFLRRIDPYSTLAKSFSTNNNNNNNTTIKCSWLLQINT